MKLGGIEYESLVDGDGIRNVLFISGCRHHCRNCHNPKLQDFDYGVEFTVEKQQAFIERTANNCLVDGITISGGDPLYHGKELGEFLKTFKGICPDKTVWCYTGFKWEELPEDTPLTHIDVLVDGKYQEDLKDCTSSFRGSTNQRILRLHGGKLI